MLISELIPGISDELAYLWDETPYDMKCQSNGFVAEQRVFLIANTHYELARESKDPDVLLARKLWVDAGDLVIELGRKKILPLKPEIAPAFHLLNQGSKIIRPAMIDTFMAWSPDWETLINELRDTEFEFGQNRFRILGYIGDGRRASTRVECRPIGFLEKDNPNYTPELQKFKLSDRIKISTLQLETVLGRRID